MQRVELGALKGRAKVFAGTAHARGDGAAPLHGGKDVHGSKRSSWSAVLVGDRAAEALDIAMAQAFGGWGPGQIVDPGLLPRTLFAQGSRGSCRI
jgi:hypothetical protein